MNCWVYICFPELAVESVFYRYPRYRSQACLVTDSRSRTVLDCNTSARHQGVRPDMTMNTALCLLQDAEIRTASSRSERRYLERLALWLYRSAASISFSGRNGLIIEAGSMLRLFGGPEAYCRTLSSNLSSTGLCFSLATGSTPDVAETFARNAISFTSADLQQEQSLLNNLSIEQLQIGESDIRKIRQLNISTYQQLTALPARELRLRLSPEVHRYLQGLRDPAPVPSGFQLPPVFREEISLLHEIHSSTAIIRAVRPVLMLLEQYLTIRCMQASALKMTFHLRDKNPEILHIRALQGCVSGSAWQDLLAGKLEHFQLPEPIIRIQLQAIQLEERQQQHSSLLSGHSQQPENNQLESILMNRLGYQNLYRLSARADAIPQYRSQKYHPGEKAPENQPYSRFHSYPLFILEQPVPVSGNSYALADRGTERIVSGRWAQDEIYRKDFIRACQSGRQNPALHWISRNPGGRWFLEGLFS